jgi:hypothetical protein
MRPAVVAEPFYYQQQSLKINAKERKGERKVAALIKEQLFYGDLVQQQQAIHDYSDTCL